jgi:hypothetical protein
VGSKSASRDDATTRRTAEIGESRQAGEKAFSGSVILDRTAISEGKIEVEWSGSLTRNELHTVHKERHLSCRIDG